LKQPSTDSAVDDRVTALAFLYCVSPVHVGSGSAIGPIDGMIQREAQTDWPTVSGASLKGALRAHCEAAWSSESEGGRLVTALFGSEAGHAEKFAGAGSFGDAQIVCFPVRSMSHSFVHATCLLALARLARLWPSVCLPALHQLPEDAALTSASNLAVKNDDLVLETFVLRRLLADGEDWRSLRSWLAQNACGPGSDFFRVKLERDLTVLPDAWFEHFARYSTLVETHVRLDDASGAHADQGLFFVENLPPESVLVSRIEISDDPIGAARIPASEMYTRLSEAIDDRLMVIGGDRSYGRGLVTVRLARPSESPRGDAT
jgi:CRISPR-associated protein Cmr4